jgi:hypothetical protein
VIIGSLIMEKFDNHSMVILYPECLVKIFERTGWDNNYGIDHKVEINSISLIFQVVHSLKIISCETRSPELCVRGWLMYLWIRRYLDGAENHTESTNLKSLFIDADLPIVEQQTDTPAEVPFNDLNLLQNHRPPDSAIVRDGSLQPWSNVETRPKKTFHPF